MTCSHDGKFHFYFNMDSAEKEFHSSISFLMKLKIIVLLNEE